MSTTIRVGIGFDVHAFTDGDFIMLAGVRIAHERGVRAHSDGDVAIHALCDALLGAAGLGDIGMHFPDSDPQWRGVAGAVLLERVLARILGGGLSISERAEEQHDPWQEMLHVALASSILASPGCSELPFERSAIAVGAFEAGPPAESLVDHLNRQSIGVAGTIEALQTVAFDGRSVQTIAASPVGAA